ncbi:rust resistance kinase Lr10-like [Corylus avellana]|uniref:rust resistance kinase Lr10-like n=1 Tax=Corylus avellana TaxID=13451 RepID=UPI002869F52C|nr:rust resistance kinase Lr10-like [Corylus avellana]
MAGQVPFSAGLSALIVIVLVHESCSTAEDGHRCAPSSCGDQNINYPFRLQDQPQNCGDGNYSLSCENNQTVLHLYAGKYYVRQINYENYTIRVVDSGIHHLSIPLYFLNRNNFSYYKDPYQTMVRKSWYRDDRKLSKGVVFLMCENPVNSRFYLETSTCFGNNGECSSNSSKLYRYVKVGRTNAEDVEDDCQIERMVQTSWPGHISSSDVHNALVYGFELSWLRLMCVPSCGSGEDCYLDDANRVRCDSRDKIFRLILYYASHFVTFLSGLIYIGLYKALITVLGTPCVIAFLIYKWRRRHLSMYYAVEEFLQTHNNLMPIRYSYSEIKKMTENFKDKLGEGGYGTVYKGMLRSGRLVAIKMLGKSKTNGQDFINEVATIGRIHHVNVVQLIGFCIQGSKQALIYEFMPKGSLNKYIFSPEESVVLSYKKIYDIAIGVARGIEYLHRGLQLIGFSIQRSNRALIYEFMPKGSLNKYIFSPEESVVLSYKKIYDIAIEIARGIEYLHRGCGMQILHFDIKPHNILLDENLTPKVSDFGLAQLYPIDNSIVSLTAARETLG